MKTFGLEIGPLYLVHDRDYGLDRRTGWSVAVRGHYLVELEPWLVVALWKAWRFGWRTRERV